MTNARLLLAPPGTHSTGPSLLTVPVMLAATCAEGSELPILEGLGLKTDDLPCLIWIEIRFNSVAGKGSVGDWLAANGYLEDKTLSRTAFDKVFTRTGCS